MKDRESARVRGAVAFSWLACAGAGVALAVWALIELIISDDEASDALGAPVASLGEKSQAQPIEMPLHAGLPEHLGVVPIDLSSTASAGAIDAVGNVQPNAGFEHVSVSGNEDRMFVAPAYFERKYEGMSRQGLEVAKSSLATAVHKFRSDEALRFFEAGRGVTQLVDPSNEGDVDRVSKSPGSNLIAFSRSEVTSSGDFLVTTGHLPWEEYIPLYDAQDELVWLMRQVELKKGASADGD